MNLEEGFYSTDLLFSGRNKKHLVLMIDAETYKSVQKGKD